MSLWQWPVLRTGVGPPEDFSCYCISNNMSVTFALADVAYQRKTRTQSQWEGLRTSSPSWHPRSPPPLYPSHSPHPPWSWPWSPSAIFGLFSIEEKCQGINQCFMLEKLQYFYFSQNLVICLHYKTLFWKFKCRWGFEYCVFPAWTEWPSCFRCPERQVPSALNHCTC